MPVLAPLQQWAPQVCDYVDAHADEVVASLSRFVRVPSVSGSDEENGIQAILADDFRQAGLDVDHWRIPLEQTLAAPDFPGVEVDRAEAWGLVGVVRGRGDGPSLMLNAHVDVVPPGDLGSWPGAAPFSGTVDAHHVRGRGACDMKGGLVAAWWAARALREVGVPLRGDVLLAAVQGEEDGGLGTYATLARGWRADACVIPEPTSLDLVPANAGSLTFRLRVRGLATHASRRQTGVSAVEKFWPVFGALRALEAERNAEVDPLMARWDIAYPIEVGLVSSGSWASSVPDVLVAEGRFGVRLGEDPTVAREALAAAVRAVCDGDPWLRDHPVEVEWWGGQFASGQTCSADAVVDSVRRAHAVAAGTPQQTWGAPYGSDLRLMTQIGGVPTVQYGPGDAALAHGPNELVAISEVLTASRTLALTALEHCGTW
jgi:acetylornithine deacetylase